MSVSEPDRTIVAERAAISQMLMNEADRFTASGDLAEAEGDERNCYAMRAVAANLRRLAAWIEQGEHHNI